MIELKSEQFKHCFYKKEGQGFPVFLVHGFGEDATIWQSQVDYLKQYYTVYTPDLFGCGLSAERQGNISMELLADYIFEIVEQEKLDKIILLGHSMGGYIGLSFLEKYEHKVNAFGLIHSTAYADDEDKKENRRKAIQLIENRGKENFIKAMIPNLYSEESKLNCQKEMKEHLTMALNISSKALVQYYKAMIERSDKTHVLKNTKVPILFVIGKEDNAVPYKEMITQSSVPSVSEVKIIENVGHTSMNEAKNELNIIINNFSKYVLQ